MGLFPIKIGEKSVDNAGGKAHQMLEKPAQPTEIPLKRRLTAALQRPFASLPSRIVMSVFVATLVTSLIVTWMSTRSIGSFLRGEIDRKFPAILAATHDRLEQWYAQREVDVETFGESRVVADNFAQLSEKASSRRGGLARDELRTYLSYVLERFPQFEALFVLDAGGAPLLWVGRERELSPALRRELAAVAGPSTSSASRVGTHLIQVVSSPMESGETGLSLHALVQIDAVEALLRSDDLGASGGIYVVDPDGAVLMLTPGAGLPERHTRPLPALGVAPAVEGYTRTTGDHVVGSAVRFGRFGWTILVEESYDEAFAPVVSAIREFLGINLGVVGVFSLVAFWMARSIVRPILALSDGALRIATGDAEVVIPGRHRTDEIGVLTRAFHEMTVRLKRNQDEIEEKRVEIEDANNRLIAQNRELQRVNEVFEQLSITDDLTKLHNHRFFQEHLRFFQEHLPQEMKRAERTGEPLSLILIDIDDFKQLNDRHGHSVGDAVLRRVADVMRAEVREMDLLARYGGEEFALLASGTTLEGAAALAEKLRVAVSEARFCLVALEGPAEIRVTLSAGVTTYRGDEKAFFNEADRAVYRAKDAGKDCIVVWDEENQSSRSSEP
jgi:diguanylate cyclase (GGDEF)-like protein